MGIQGIDAVTSKDKRDFLSGMMESEVSDFSESLGMFLAGELPLSDFSVIFDRFRMVVDGANDLFKCFPERG